MSAVAYERRGDSSVLRFHDKSYPKPMIKNNQMLIQVHYSSLNPVDIKLRRNPVPNLLLPKPKIPGADIAGVVVATGSTSTKFRKGDRVAAMMPLVGARWGAAAEFVAIDENIVGRVGDQSDLAHAASFPLVGLTSICALNKIENPNGKRILIHAGAGGVGSFAIQYAKRVLGMYVISTASEGKTEKLKSLGCDEVIDYRTSNFEDILQKQPVDVVLDPMSFAYEERSQSVLKPGGHYLNIPSSGWGLKNGREETNFGLTIQNVLKAVILPTKIKYTLSEMQPDGQIMQQMLDLLDNGTLEPVIDRVYNLQDAPLAHDYLEGGHVTGKVILNHTHAIL
eukprot:CAMPEP_0172449348 /NCGR_PEP_ID=MMETSP1065-20121228/8082_1 /TAXON_ID=265537 /ORGANISM="Amphiprora paludosa, Strain CCMP125" /LENGTH=337 /DNA_ID=CAMNT_0013201009 /DNA_START=25 /DNA_END=1038 /DNA_ORIENTATION=-